VISTCVSGTCACTSPPDFLCPRACVGLMTDASNCGRGGYACAAGVVSMVGCCGRCTMPPFCVSATFSCTGAGGASTTSTATCGGGPCDCKTSGESVCGGVCVNPLMAAANCGGCGRVCPPTAMCMSGACYCPTGQTNRGTVCANLQSDSNNYGFCGLACTAPG